MTIVQLEGLNMSVEIVNTINDFNVSFPRNVDLLREGDDHIRNVKKGLKNTFPKVQGVVNFSHEKLNNLDVAIESVDKDGNFVLKKSLTMKRGSSVNMTDAKIQKVGKGTEDTDAVNLGQVKEMITEAYNALLPEGHIVFTIENRNPAITYGYGEWKLISIGRAIIGAGKTYREDGGLLSEWVAGKEYGTDTYRLSMDNIPNHSFTFEGETSVGGDHYHGFGGDDQLSWGNDYYDDRSFRYDSKSDGGANARYYKTTNDGAHKHTFKGTTNSVGKGESFTVVPPSYALYVWRRVK